MATQTTRTLPAQFVEDLGKDLATQVVAQTAIPVVSTGLAGISQRPGEDPDAFKARQEAAKAFEIRQQNLAGLAPTVAGQTAQQQEALRLAEAASGTTGIASFQPFLQQAQQAATDVGTTLGGVGLGPITAQQLATIDPATGQTVTPQLAAGSFMSPFQTQVIDATLAEFDRNKAIQEQQIRDQQTALGALGSGRAGVQLAEFGTGAARERALLQANLLQQGFGQAMAARQQDIANRGALAAQQQGLGAFQAGLGGQREGVLGSNIARLGQLGALNQAQAQAQADATREAARQAAFLPQEQLDRYAAQVTGIMGGYPAQFQSTNIPNPTPLQTALGVGTTLAGIYGGLTGGNKTDFGALAAGGAKILSG